MTSAPSLKGDPNLEPLAGPCWARIQDIDRRLILAAEQAAILKCSIVGPVGHEPLADPPPTMTLSEVLTGMGESLSSLEVSLGILTKEWVQAGECVKEDCG